MNLKRLTASVVTALFGAAMGLLIGFLNSGLAGVSRGFWYWISYPPDSWHWPALGFLAGFLGCLAFNLWRRALSVWIYIDTSKQVGDKDHLKVFADEEAAQRWFAEHDPEGVAFEYQVVG